jgi:hypothetical protein
MCSADTTTTAAASGESSSSCVERLGNQIDDGIRHVFYKLGHGVAFRPKLTIVLSILLALLCGAGFLQFTTENRPEELWVPQGTIAETEEASYEALYPSTSRINTMIVSASQEGGNVLTKDAIQQALELHRRIEGTASTYENATYTLTDLCTKSGGTCASSFAGACQCLISGILGVWNYDVDVFAKDTDFMTTLTTAKSPQDLEALLGNPVFDQDGQLVSAEAFVTSYFLDDRSIEQDGNVEDPINEAWEKDAFLDNVEAQVVEQRYPALTVDYFSSRSFSDEFGYVQQ